VSGGLHHTETQTAVTIMKRCRRQRTPVAKRHGGFVVVDFDFALVTGSILAALAALFSGDADQLSALADEAAESRG
jgi:hypothetical protein